MLAGAPARIVDIGPVGAERSGELHHVTRRLARKLAPAVTVNAIAPGPVETEVAVDHSIPLQRLGGPDDIAGAVLYLCSPAGAWVTGSVLTVDGGLSLT